MQSVLEKVSSRIAKEIAFAKRDTEKKKMFVR